MRKEVASFIEEQPDLLRACHRQLYGKTVLGFALLTVAWATLVFAQLPTYWVAVAAVAFLFGAVIQSVCLLHDANHGAFFKSRRWNHLLGWTVDVVLGFGSYAWRYKHNVSHHTYPNVDGYDDDIAHAPFARLAASQPVRPWYRWQHMYMWFVYPLALFRWHITDLMSLRRNALGKSQFRPPRGWDLVGVLVGKFLFVCGAIGVPLLFHEWQHVLLMYFALTMTASAVMAVVFQLAHAVEEADFASPQALAAEPREWAVYEVESTVGFCHDNSALTWLLGGLNFQIEHHLFPRLPHTIYPLIAPIVESAARAHGVRYYSHPTLRAAVASHYRHLRAMGVQGVRPELEMG
ncbi:MAG: fatty acid desaturase family protein [Gaiellaceae bacterium]